MKTNIFKGLLLCGVAVALAGCDENTWNEDNLDGFAEPNLNASSERTYIDYTLTSTDYTRIAGMAANVEKATANGVLADLQAVGTNKYFTSTITPSEYMVAWLDSIANTSGSAFKSATALTTARISYSTSEATPAIVTGINNAMTYTVSTNDYIAAYDPDATDPEKAKYAEAFSPACTADDHMNSILKAQFPNAASGDYVFVTYNQSSTNPVWNTGGGDTPGDDTPGGDTPGGDTPGGSYTLSNTISTMVDGTDVTVTGYVCGISTKGLIITDNSGTCASYTPDGIDPTAFKLGQVLTVSGTVATYGGGAQIGSNASGESPASYGAVLGIHEVSFTPTELDGEEFDNLLARMYAERSSSVYYMSEYVKFTADVSVSGSYINLIVEGAEKKGSIYYATDAQKAAFVDGTTVTVEGWAMAVSGSGGVYLNVTPVYVDGEAVVEFANGALTPGGGDTPGGDTPGGSYTLSNIISTMADGSDVTVTGYVCGVSTKGLIITDNSGSCATYTPAGIDPTAYKLGQVLTVSGTVATYGGGAQIGSNASGESPASYGAVQGIHAFSFTPTELDGEDFDNLLARMYAENSSSVYYMSEYVTFTAAVSVSGNYINLIVEGAEKKGSIYYATDAQKAAFVDGTTVTVEGWAMAVSGSGGAYLNVTPVFVDGTAVVEFADGALTAAARVRAMSRAAADLATETVNAVYTYTGSKWTLPTDDVYVVSAADYAQMGVTSLSTTAAAEYLPKLLANKRPYAAEGDVVYVVYNTHQCEQYAFDGAAWASNTMLETSQFIRLASMKWLFDPTVYVTFTTGSYGTYTDPVSEAFWFGCVNWVWDNINVAQLGLDNSLLDTWDASAIVHHGYCWGKGKPTQEGYGGASAFYGNIDTRVSKTLKGYLGDDFDVFYGGMSDTEVQALVQKRFETEVAPGALARVYPDAVPRTDGIDQDYEITVTQYNPSTHLVTLRYRVVAPATFQLVESDWGVGAVSE